MYEYNALGYWSGLTLCLTKVRSSRARCPATALILFLLKTQIVGEAVLTSTHNLCFRAKIRKIGKPLHTPFLLYKSGVQWGIHYNGHVLTCFLMNVYLDCMKYLDCRNSSCSAAEKADNDVKDRHLI